jgi:hypothetical protein
LEDVMAACLTDIDTREDKIQHGAFIKGVKIEANKISFVLQIFHVKEALRKFWNLYGGV